MCIRDRVGREPKAELELLDAFLRKGIREIEVVRTRFPGVLLVKTPLLPLKALEVARSMVMAYVRSVIPLEEVVKADIEAVVAACLHLAKGLLEPDRSFAVRCRRRGRCLPSSTEVEKIVGEALRKATGASVDLEEPDLIFRIEVVDDIAGICVERGRRRRQRAL